MWTCFARLCKAQYHVGGQPVLVSLSPVVRRRRNRQSVTPVQSTQQTLVHSGNSPASSSPRPTMAQNAAQNTEEFAAMMAAFQRIVDLQRISVASTSTVHPVPAAQPTPDPPPLVENLQVQDPQDMFPLALAYRPLAQPLAGILSFDINEIDPILIKITRLEKALKKSQGFNSTTDIEDGHTEASIRLLKKIKMPHIDRFDGSGDPIVHV